MASQTRRAAGKAARAERQPADDLPVARVAVDISLPNLDRPFEYLMPADLASAGVPGCRVRVRFAGRLTSGFLLERAAESEHQGKLGFIERIVSPEPVLTAEIAGLARAVADRYGGTLADVLRLAVPPRHGAVESEPAERSATVPPEAHQGQPDSSWRRYQAGEGFLAALADGRSPRAIWSALPGASWPGEIAQTVAAVAGSGRGAVVVVPDAKDLERVDAALGEQLGARRYVVLSAGLGPAERYRRWLAACRGDVQVVAGTRSAAFAPVSNLGLVVLWDEGDDLLAEPRAPYPHAREVLAMRAHRARAGALIGGFARTAEAALLLSGGWAKPLAADRSTVREVAPAVLPAGEDPELARDEAARSARLPSLALRTIRTGLEAGPVLVQVPRQGYLAAVACEQCRMQARCDCGGPAELPGAMAALRCGWCAADLGRVCARCGHDGLRALVTGAGRTAEELTRAFRTVPVLTSGGAKVTGQVGDQPTIVVATPGAEPVAAAGYSAAVLVDGWALLGRASLRAAEEALRRWMNAAALVRPAPLGGTVVVVADQGQPAVQALVRWDPATFADRELAARSELRFPPAARMAALTGPVEAVEGLLAAIELPDGAEVLGPVPVSGATASGTDSHSRKAGKTANRISTAMPEQPDLTRFLVRVPRSEGVKLASALHAGQAVRTARKEAGTVRVQLDPAALV